MGKCKWSIHCLQEAFNRGTRAKVINNLILLCIIVISRSSLFDKWNRYPPPSGYVGYGAFQLPPPPSPLTPEESHRHSVALGVLVCYIVGMFTLVPHIVSILLSFHMQRKGYLDDNPRENHSHAGIFMFTMDNFLKSFYQYSKFLCHSGAASLGFLYFFYWVFWGVRLCKWRSQWNVLLHVVGLGIFIIVSHHHITVAVRSRHRFCHHHHRPCHRNRRYCHHHSIS